ncbi:MAG: acyl carrier protein [Gemmatimonadales bacterium]
MRAETHDRLGEIFAAVLELGAGEDPSQLRRGRHPKWDSLAHVMLIGALESEFGFEVDTADSLALDSYDAVAAYLEGRGL